MSAELDILPTRDSIDALQRAMVTMEQAELPTLHHYADGMYCREMHAPAGCTIVGKVHKSEHFFMLIAGEMTLVADGFQQRVRAPFIAVSKPGIKRAGYAHEDCVCVNVHNVEGLTDVEEIERYLIEPDPAARFDAYNRAVPLALENPS